MLGKEEQKEVLNILSFFKREVEKRCCVETEVNELEDGANILVVRSARMERYVDMLRELEKTEKELNLFVLGETDDTIENYIVSDRINVRYLKTYGRFKSEKVNEYKRLIGNEKIQWVIYLNPAMHSCNIFNVYEVVWALSDSGQNVMKYMSKDQWMKYCSFSQYVQSFKVYKSVWDWCMYGIE